MRERAVSRLGQFFRAVAAYGGLSDAERRWVGEHLSVWEEALFWQMSVVDQKHAVRVSMRAAEIARAEGNWDRVAIRTLVRAGLLHDIGKVGGDIGLVDRVAIVLIWRLLPRLARALVARGEEALVNGAARRRLGSGLCRAFYAQAVHSQRGAAMARLFGVEEPVVDVIRHHHRPGEGDRLLEVFARADR